MKLSIFKLLIILGAFISILKQANAQDTLNAHQLLTSVFLQIESQDSLNLEEISEKTTSVLQKYKQELGPNHARIGQINYDLGWAWTNRGQYVQAINYFEGLVAVRKTIDQCDSLLVATYRYLAALTNQIDRPSESVNWSREARGCLEKISQNDVAIQDVLAILYKSEGEAYMSLSKYDSAAKYLQTSSQIRQKIPYADSLPYATIWGSLGGFFIRIQERDSAVHYLNMSLNTYLKYSTSRAKTGAAITLTNLAFIHNMYNEFDEAQKYLLRAIELKKQVNGDLQPPFSNLGLAYSELGYYEKAQDFFDKSIEQLVLRREDGGLKHARVLFQISENYLKQKELTLAIETISKVIDMMKPLDAYLELGYAMITKGKIYQGLKDYEQSEEMYLKAVEYFKLVFKIKNSEQGLAYNYLSDLALTANQLEKSLNYNRLSIEQFRVQPALNKLPDIPMHIDLLESLILRAEIFHKFYVKTHQQAYRDSAIQALDLGRKAIGLHSQNMSRVDQIELYDSFYKVFELGMDILTENSAQGKLDIAQIFEWIEGAKATGIRLSNAKKIAKASNTLPDEVLREEEALEMKTKILSKKFAEGTFEDTTIFDFLERWNDNQNNYNSFIAYLKNQFPAYYQLKYDIEVSSLSETQKALDRDQAFLEYFCGEKYIYILVITRDKAIFHKEIFTPDLYSRIEQMRSGLGQDNVSQIFSKDNQHLYLKNAYKIYETVWNPITKYLKGKKRIFVVADGPLGYIPFDALLEKEVDLSTWDEDYRSLPYLLKKYQISTQLSATQWLYSLNKKAQNKLNLLAIAPTFSALDYTANINPTFGRYGLDSLRLNLLEADSIQKIWGGDTLKGKMASLERFKEMASKYGILHIATHGQADNKGESFLAFYSNNDTVFSLLPIEDIYGLNLDCELVVLSACETSLGQLRAGEGIINFAHGFTYAGSKSMITSLWKVNEQSTVMLMKAFYEYLKQGKNKDEALSLAKLDLLNTEYTHPFYWAAFVPTGEMGALTYNNWFNYSMFILLGLLMILGAVFFVRRKTNSF